MPRISIIIVTFNHARTLRVTLEAVLAQAYGDFEVLVYDNASSDASLEIAREFQPRVRVLASRVNRGFCGGNNDAVAASRGELILLCNPDVELSDPEYLTKLDGLYRADSTLAIVGGKLWYPDRETLQHCGGMFTLPAHHTLRGRGETDLGQFDAPAEVDYVEGSALAVPRHVWDDLHGFDEIFWPAFYEELDLCARARRAGVRVSYRPELAAVHHAEDRSSAAEDGWYWRTFQAHRLMFTVRLLGWGGFLKRAARDEWRWFRNPAMRDLRRGVWRAYARAAKRLLLGHTPAPRPSFQELEAGAEVPRGAAPLPTPSPRLSPATKSAAAMEPQPAPQALELPARGQRVHVITVNYHRADLTAKAVRSALDSDFPGVRVIVVDNESDGTWQHEPLAHDPRVETIVNHANLGFGAACNQGIEHAAADPECAGVLLLNNDAQLAPNTISLLRASAAEFGMAAPKIVLPDERIFSAGGIVELHKARARNRGIYQPDQGQFDHAETMRFASACVLLIDIAALRGGIRFFEPYFLYYEDTDLCLRLARAGYEVQYVPHATATHLESASTTGPDREAALLYYNTRNRLVFLKRNGNWCQRGCGYLYMLGTGLIKSLRLIARHDRLRVRALWNGWRDFLAGRLGPRCF